MGEKSMMRIHFFKKKKQQRQEAGIEFSVQEVVGKQSDQKLDSKNDQNHEGATKVKVNSDGA